MSLFLCLFIEFLWLLEKIDYCSRYIGNYSDTDIEENLDFRKLHRDKDGNATIQESIDYGKDNPFREGIRDQINPKERYRLVIADDKTIPCLGKEGFGSLINKGGFYIKYKDENYEIKEINTKYI